MTAAPAGPVASATRSAGRCSAGGVVSVIVTWNAPLAVLPCASVERQVTVVLPSANVEPAAGVQATAVEPSTRSCAVAMIERGAPAGPIASAARSCGSARTGGVVSRTVTLKPPDAVLPCASVDVQVTTVVVLPDTEPLGGLQLTATSPSTMSCAVG